MMPLSTISISYYSVLTIVTLAGISFSGIALILQRKHLLSALLSLESMTLNLFVLLLGLCNNSSFESHISLVIITLGACEASLGLAILVSLVRAHGNDYVFNFNTQKC